MTNKEYRAKVATYGGYDYLNRAEEKELRRTVKANVKLNNEVYLSENSFRATIMYDYWKGAVLKSYNTEVCAISRDGRFYKIWDDYSATTLRHINMFREKYNLGKLSKREWVEMEMY